MRKSDQGLQSALPAILVILTCLLFLGSASAVGAQQAKKFGQLYLKEYQAKDQTEVEIINTLLQYEGAFNAHDLQKFVSLFTENGQYRPCGANTHPIADKACQAVLSYNFKAYGFETYYDPQISVDGDRATVRLLLETGSNLGDYTLWLQRVGEMWLVSKNDYSNTRYKGN
jgi:hypothetical protein